MIALVDKDIKIIIVTIFYIPYEEARKKNEYVKQKHERQKRTHVRLLGLKTTISKIKHTLNGIN